MNQRTESELGGRGNDGFGSDPRNGATGPEREKLNGVFIEGDGGAGGSRWGVDEPSGEADAAEFFEEEFGVDVAGAERDGGAGAEVIPDADLVDAGVEGVDAEGGGFGGEGGFGDIPGDGGAGAGCGFEDLPKFAGIDEAAAVLEREREWGSGGGEGGAGIGEVGTGAADDGAAAFSAGDGMAEETDEGGVEEGGEFGGAGDGEFGPLPGGFCGMVQGDVGGDGADGEAGITQGLAGFIGVAEEEADRAVVGDAGEFDAVEACGFYGVQGAGEIESVGEAEFAAHLDGHRVTLLGMHISNHTSSARMAESWPLTSPICSGVRCGSMT